MSSDNTLMSVVRTSLSLISFGFTIFQFFLKLNSSALHLALPTAAPRRFGLSLILLGVTLLILGILNHLRDARRTRERRRDLFARHLIDHPPGRQLSGPLLVALMLLAIGLLVVAGILFRQGPY
jgi:putative membrane protein